MKNELRIEINQKRPNIKDIQNKLTILGKVKFINDVDIVVTK